MYGREGWARVASIGVLYWGREECVCMGVGVCVCVCVYGCGCVCVCVCVCMGVCMVYGVWCMVYGVLKQLYGVYGCLCGCMYGRMMGVWVLWVCGGVGVYECVKVGVYGCVVYNTDRRERLSHSLLCPHHQLKHHQCARNVMLWT
jgi:hypothetical protein